MAKREQNYYLLTFNEDWADEHSVPALACMDEKRYKEWSETKLNIRAQLGNNGDYFMEDEQGSTGAELVKNGTVSKYIVDESFKKLFDKADLEYLSLSNVFDGDEYEDDEEEEEDDRLKEEEYYETRGVGTGARSDKTCYTCSGNIPKGEPHDMHHFYPEFHAYATHKQCSKEFMSNLR